VACYVGWMISLQRHMLTGLSFEPQCNSVCVHARCFVDLITTIKHKRADGECIVRQLIGGACVQHCLAERRGCCERAKAAPSGYVTEEKMR
jgi:hypothetical protein